MSENFWSELWEKIKGLVKSRKFWALAVGIVFAVYGGRAGYDEQALLAAVVTIVSYILGTALEDGLSRRA
jgi:hypothetical protein